MTVTKSCRKPNKVFCLSKQGENTNPMYSSYVIFIIGFGKWEFELYMNYTWIINYNYFTKSKSIPNITMQI